MNFAEFSRKKVPNHTKTLEKGGVIQYDDKIYIKVMSKTSKDTYIGEATPDLITEYQPAYDAFLERDEVPEDGTDLRTIPLFTPEEIESLKDANIKTLETFTGMNLDELPPEFHNVHGEALVYMKSAKSHAAMARQFSHAKKRADLLEEENKKLRQENDTLNATNKVLRETLNPGSTAGVDTSPIADIVENDKAIKRADRKTRVPKDEQLARVDVDDDMRDIA